ncbi:MAG: polysaccharide deacetylase, partial [bacterium]
MNVQDLPRIPVLLYHRLDREKDSHFRPYCVDPEKFARQMSFLKAEGYETISLEDMQRHYQFGDQVPERSIVITFDDGYYCNYTQAYPILQE